MSNRILFNVAGPCVSGRHYMLDPLRGYDDELMKLVDEEQYFVLHAARQVGKTTLLLDIVDRINAAGKYYAVYCSLEVLDNIVEPEKGIPIVVDVLKRALKDYGLPAGFATGADRSEFAYLLKDTLTDYCKTLDKPLVIFFDEADCLSNGTLITFLRQLRYGYITRGRVRFVHSVALVGMRNIRDYKSRVRPDRETLGGPSPFNIITESRNLRNFTHAEVAELYAQHTAETGQVFETDVIDYVFEQTQGQPWLVNAIARQCVEKITKEDYAIPITKEMAAQAIQNIITARETHVDSMMDKLKYPGVNRVITSVITGDIITNMDSDEYQFTKDLGLIRDDRRKIEPANPIYAELIIRTLNWNVQQALKHSHPQCDLPRYLKADGTLDMNLLIKEFQIFWRENGGTWETNYQKSEYQYNEAAAQLVMQGFLQRVVNGGGTVIRELAANTRRADLCVIHNGQKYPVEIKILQNEDSRIESYEQILSYMDTFGADTGWLVIFDKRADKKRSWEEKIYMREETVDGKKVVVAGC